jgi:hypothetical protein
MPVNPKKTSQTPFLLIALIFLFIGYLFGCSDNADRRPSPDGLLFDTAGIVEQGEMLARILTDYRDRFGIELIITTGSGPDFDDINAHAQALFSEWRIGSNFDGRGLLLVVDAQRGKGRLEVSYDLEHVFTDFLCGRIIRNQVRPFWEMDMIYVGMLDAVFQISERSKLLALEESVASTRAQEADRFLSGGGGVTTPIDFGVGREVKKRLKPEQRQVYGPGTTPEDVLARFADAMAQGVNDNTLEMYTPATQVFFAMEPTLTSEYQTYAAIISDGKPYTVRSDDHRAVIQMRLDLARRIPIFCRKSPNGWQIDWVTLFHSHGKSLEGEWIMHRVPKGYTHLIEGVDNVQNWATRLPVTIDSSIDFRIQVREAERLLEQEPLAPDRYVHLADLYLSCWRWPDALRLYAQAAALAPDKPRYLADLAEAKYYLYFLESAGKNYHQLQRFPEWQSLSARRLKQIDWFLGES